MKRILAIIAASLLFGLTAFAGGGEFFGRLHPGIEWGYTLTLAAHHHYNYLDESIGFRINDEGWTMLPRSNAYILGSLKYSFSSVFSTSIISGFQGIYKDRRTVPLLCRVSVSPSGRDSDGFFFFSDMGVFLTDFRRHGNQFQIGSGYSIVLAPRCSIGLRIGARLIYDRPDVWDPIEEEYISEQNIRRNDAWYSALNMGIVLEF